jgi:hypothetical protein
MGSHIFETPIEMHRMNNDISLEKMVYFTCSCTELKHIGRLRFTKDITIALKEIEGKIVKTAYIRSEDCYFEFDASQWIYIAYDGQFPKNKLLLWFFLKYIHVKHAFRLLIGKPVFSTTDIALDFDAVQKLAKSMLNTTDEFNSQVMANL